MYQNSLWQQEPPVRHSLIEVHYQSGRRKWICTANPADWQPKSDQDRSIYAGFVYGVSTNPCPVCSKQQTVENNVTL